MFAIFRLFSSRDFIFLLYLFLVRKLKTVVVVIPNIVPEQIEYIIGIIVL